MPPLNNKLAPDLLRNQFVLGRAMRTDLPGWRQRDGAGWVLQAHPSLPIIELQGEADVFSGWLLGFPCTINGLLRDGAIVQIPGQTKSFMANVEQYMAGLAGRWLAIVFASGEGRIYLDPYGSLAAVYSTDEPVLCSTPSVIGKGTEDVDWDANLVAALPARWYPFGLTPHRSLRRLLANHYLDLEQWQVVRHWPHPADLTSSTDKNEIVSQAVDILCGIMTVLVRDGAYMTLTAGFDTRVQLACSHDVASEATYFTSTGSRMDIQAAQELAKRLGLRHVIVTERRPTSAEKAMRLYLAGYSTDVGSWDRIGNHRQQLDASQLQVVGHGGHLGRGISYLSGDFKADPETILQFLHLPQFPQLVQEAGVWCNELSYLNPHQIADLAFVEIRTSCWAGPNQYAIDGTSLTTVYGFAHRGLCGLMMRLPYQYRKSQEFFTDICKRTWPQVLEVPINQPWGIVRPMTFIARAGKKVRQALQ